VNWVGYKLPGRTGHSGLGIHVLSMDAEPKFLGLGVRPDLATRL